MAIPSSWAWGAYRAGMGGSDAPMRQIHACRAIKQELHYLGLGEKLDLSTSKFGKATRKAVKDFQAQFPLVVDGLVGRKTANALWSHRISELQEALGIEDSWLRAQVHWESGDDPGAELINTDGTADRGLCQLNSTRKPLTEDQAFDPASSIPYLADHLRDEKANYAGCDTPAIRLAVGAWRTPVGASEWCDDPNLTPDKDGTWGQRAAYYVGRVDTDGRKNWA